VKFDVASECKLSETFLILHFRTVILKHAALLSDRNYSSFCVQNTFLSYIVIRKSIIGWAR
jgi:hypothetical protein